METKTETETTKELTVLEERDLYDEVFNKYALWKSLPRIYLKRLSPDEMMRNIGMDDELMLEMAQIKTQDEFAEKHNIHPNTLSRWNKKIQERDPLYEAKGWAQTLVKNMVFAMYTHAIQKGDAQLFKLWFQVVNDWNEKSVVEHSVPELTKIIIKRYEKPIEINANDVKQNQNESSVPSGVAADGKTGGGVQISHR